MNVLVSLFVCLNMICPLCDHVQYMHLAYNLDFVKLLRIMCTYEV